jgi:hypothetical protein
MRAAMALAVAVNSKPRCGMLYIPRWLSIGISWGGTIPWVGQYPWMGRYQRVGRYPGASDAIQIAIHRYILGWDDTLGGTIPVDGTIPKGGTRARERARVRCYPVCYPMHPIHASDAIQIAPTAWINSKGHILNALVPCSPPAGGIN